VNCTEAQALLAAYRELKNEQQDTTELDVHLEHCASCRQVLARNSLIGNKLSALPAVELPAYMREKLMQTLADEHVKLLHRQPSTIPSVPEFLQPYLQGQTQHTEKRDLLTAFSTAETGPLPIIHAKRKRQRRPQMSQFAVIGLAAVFLMMLMMGGLASLLLLGHGKLEKSVTSQTSISLNQPSNVAEAKYITSTPYSHVVSAVADRSSIYYTAYTDGATNSWMLEQLDRTTHLSTPLLPTASANPLVVLGSSGNWLVWLELDAAKAVAPGNKFVPSARSLTRTWSLHYLSLTSQQQGPDIPLLNSQTLFSSTFNESLAPDWVSTPVQGICFIQDSLLVAMIDKSGISHLLLFQLGPANASPIEIAIAGPGHVFTSPTATSDGTSIYWSEEWRTDDGTLHSNIWAQQVLDNVRPLHGAWIDGTTTQKYLLRSDGMSFRPQVVDDSLFLLSTANPADSTGATATTTPTPAPTPSVDTTPTISRVDPSIYGLSPDDAVQGSILMLPIHAYLTTPLSEMNKLGQASSLQVGTDFAVWQTNKGYEMYDVRTGYVTIGQDILNGARFLAVNGNTATWVASNANNNGAITPTPSSATLMAFDWPEA
jgi:hypothetical protein